MATMGYGGRRPLAMKPNYGFCCEGTPASVCYITDGRVPLLKREGTIKNEQQKKDRFGKDL